MDLGCSPDRDDLSRPAPGTGVGGILVPDDAGEEVWLAAPARRVVSLVPSVTETIVALGEAERLVARTDYDRGREVAGLPSVGGGLDPGPEALVALKPDLVVAWDSPRNRSLRDLLQIAGVPLLAVSIEDTTDVFRTFDRLGKLLDVPGAADRLAAALRDSLAAVAADRAPGPAPSVLYTLLGAPPRTAGPGTFVTQLVDIAGGRPAFPELRERWPEVSLEAVVERQPDVLLVPVPPDTDARKMLARRKGWRDLTAVREGRVIGVDADLFSRPGPRMAEAARALQRALER